MSQVHFDQVGKLYCGNIWAVKDFSLQMNEGEFVSFLGPSGCGKTTTLRIVAGLEQNTHGSLSFDAELVSDAKTKLFIPPEKRKVGMVFQSYAVWPHMNVFENVAYPLRLQKLPKAAIRQQVTEVLQKVELHSLEDRMPSQLSGGQQQRVALARGLVMKPRILLLDEPLSNLDAKLREKMRKDIRALQKELGLTLIYVTHDQAEAFQMSDRVVIMNAGSIQQVGTPDEIRTNPANEFIKDFLSAH